jgi:protein AroM
VGIYSRGALRHLLCNIKQVIPGVHLVKNVHVVLYSRYTEETGEFLKASLETSAELTICGALDGLSDDQLREMAADPPATGAPVELADGSWFYVAHDHIDQRARSVVKNLQAEGAETVLMCCTLPWHSLEELPGVICPSLVLEANAMALLPKGGTLGVVQPDAITSGEEIKHWLDLGVPVLATTISPDENSIEELTDATNRLVEQGADLIVLDCLAFAREHWRQVREATGKPVLLPISIVGKVLDEAYG